MARKIPRSPKENVKGRRDASKTGSLYEKDIWTKSYDVKGGVGTLLMRALDAALQVYGKDVCIDVSTAWRLPLIRWNGHSFERVSLADLGLIVQLGHDGQQCPDPSPARQILVFHSNGYHSVNVRLCECATVSSDAPPSWRQFLRADWFPATHTRPSTAFTVELLKLFHELTLQAKINTYDFYWSLLRATNNSGTTKHPHRYKQFGHAVRLWRHLRQLKRGGRGHDPAGASATTPGSLAVVCPACPHPDKNLPPNWELTPPEKLWIYTLYLMMDANFRCRCKDRGLDDVSLAPGWSYYVDNKKFQDYLRNDCGFETEQNTCSAEHNAILKANLRKEGYVASGIGAVLCARHAFFRPNGCGDLHLGEKFPYMDYFLISTLLGVILFLLVISYDIACQYCRNFERRVARNFPEEMHLDFDDINVRWMIPKNHIAVHGSNHSRYSLNFNEKVGRTYGEGVESSWSHLNPAAMSTREMALATRHEVLDDHMGAWNWQKVIGLGDHLLRCLNKARSMAQKNRGLFEEFSSTFEPNVVREWSRLVDVWCANPGSVPDPFEEPQANLRCTQVHLAFAQEEANVSALQGLPQLDMSPSVFVQVGLDLEELQRTIRSKAGSHHSDKDLVDLLQQRNSLRRRIYVWTETQHIYMPAVVQLRIQTNTTLPLLPDDAMPDGHPENEDVDIVNPEDLVLWLPSAIPSSLRIGDFTQRLSDFERRLRLAQIEDSLSTIRRVRRMLKGISEFKRLHISGTGNRANMRSRTLYSKFVQKQACAVAQYRSAYRALSNLDPNGPWRNDFRELLDSHLTGPGISEEGPGEGSREISWIWLVQRPESVEDPDEARQYNDSMRAEWARTRARAERWEEEVELLVEEMRRVLAFLEHEADWWTSIVDRRAKFPLRVPTPFDIIDGVRAYAHRQAATRRSLVAKFARLWLPWLRKNSIDTDWTSRYESLVDPNNVAIVRDMPSRPFVDPAMSESDKDDDE
ncbi:hypothetical protein VTO73DRAFT_7632 [Trametes versicolor]